MKKYLIVYQGGTGGNLIAGLIYTLQTNTAIAVRENGSIHGYHHWEALVENNLDKNYDTELTNIFTTHDRNIKDFASNNDLTVIKIVYKPESTDLIRRLVSTKAQIPTLKQWYLSLPGSPFDNVDLDNICNDSRVIDFLYQCLNNRIGNFMDAVTYYHHTVNFEDIWNNQDRLLGQLSDITGLKTNENTIQLIQNYVTINNRLYLTA
jgi:hypothetical protein